MLSKTSYDVLKNLDLKRSSNRRGYYDDDVDELVQTISNVNTLNKLDDAGLAASMFSDLQGHDENTQVSNLSDIKELIKENKVYDKKEQTMDNSFFTSDLKLRKKDFDGYEEEKEGSVLKTVFITILILGVICFITVVVLQKLGIF